MLLYLACIRKTFNRKEKDMTAPFNALEVTENPPGTFTRRIVRKTPADLPPGDVLIQVHFSSLNYKDALSAVGNKGVTRTYPHTPGIDAAGVVAEGKGADFSTGDPVLVTGYDLGMNTAGGFGQYIRVPASWVVRLPEGLSMEESMILGTAGFTAGLSVDKIVSHGILPGEGKILVTGASGGVGSLAVAVLSRLGYTVAAATGKVEEADFLKDHGASEILSREAIRDAPSKALLKERWAAVVDTVGGEYLAAALKTTAYRGAVTCCGNVAAASLSLTVYPFILRGITLYGVDSANCPMEPRKTAWEKLAGPWKPAALSRLAREIPMDQLDSHIDRILEGKLKGRTLVRMKEGTA